MIWLRRGLHLLSGRVLPIIKDVRTITKHLAGNEEENSDPAKSNAVLRYYSSAEAIDECSVYSLYPEEEYFIIKYWRLGDRILDLACGLGRTTVRLHEMGFSVVGIDLSENLIRAAKQRSPYLDLRVGSFTSIGEPNASYSHVLISSNAIDLALPQTSRLAALDECARVRVVHQEKPRSLGSTRRSV